MALEMKHYYGRPRSEPDWIIPGWLKRFNSGFILGMPKRACKSWMLLALAWDLAEGKPVWGVQRDDKYTFVPPRPMRVCYFTQEDAEDDIQDRIELCVKGGRTLSSNLFIVPKDLRCMLDAPILHASNGNILDEHILSACDGEGHLDLVIFDPMRRMHNGEENDSESINIIWQRLAGIQNRFQCATLFSHHVSKPPKDTGASFDATSPNAARGSGDIYGGGDAFINVLPKAMHDEYASRDLDLYFETKRSRGIAPIKLSCSFETGLITFKGWKKAQ